MNRKEVDEMTTKEVDRLIDWLLAHGHSAEEIRDCIKHIAGTNAPKKA